MKNYLSCSRFVASPNCDERPENIDIDLIVIHAISLPPRVYGGSDVEAFFQNKLDFTKNKFYKSVEITVYPLTWLLLTQRQKIKL